MVSKAHEPDQDEAHVPPLTVQDDWNEYASSQDITNFLSAKTMHYRPARDNLGQQLSQFLNLLSQEVEVPYTQDNATQDNDATKHSVLVAVAKAFVEETARLQEVDINWDRNAAPQCSISHLDSKKYDKNGDFDCLVDKVQSNDLTLLPYDFTDDAKLRCTTDLVRIA